MILTPLFSTSCGQLKMGTTSWMTPHASMLNREILMKPQTMSAHDQQAVMVSVIDELRSAIAPK